MDGVEWSYPLGDQQTDHQNGDGTDDGDNDDDTGFPLGEVLVALGEVSDSGRHIDGGHCEGVLGGNVSRTFAGRLKMQRDEA